MGFSVDSNEEYHLLEHSDISWAPGLPLVTLVPAHKAGKGSAAAHAPASNILFNTDILPPGELWWRLLLWYGLVRPHV